MGGQTSRIGAAAGCSALGDFSLRSLGTWQPFCHVGSRVKCSLGTCWVGFEAQRFSAGLRWVLSQLGEARRFGAGRGV